MLSGDNGILQRATDAKTNTDNAQIKERVQLAYTAALADENGVLTEPNLRAELTNEFGDNYDLSEDTTTNEWVISVNEIERLRVGIENVAQTSATLASQLGNTESERAIHFGDYINYGIELDIDNANTEHKTDWRIFYADENGTFIIAADYVPYSNTILKTAMGETKANMDNYANYRTNQGTSTNGYEYSAYWPDSSYYTHKDADGNAIIDSNASTFMYNWSGMQNIAIGALLDTNSWNGFLTQGATMAIGGPTLEMYRASWNAKEYSSGVHKKLQIGISNNSEKGYSMMAGEEFIESSSNSRVWVSDSVDGYNDEGYNDTLYFPHKTEVNNCKDYWVASPINMSGNSFIASISCEGCIGSAPGTNYYTSTSNYLGLRPLVFLPSSIKAEIDQNNVWQINE